MTNLDMQGPVFDLRQLPQGQTYEDRYQGFLTLLRDIAMTPARHRVVIDGAPWSWVPLLHHLNCDLRISPRVVFQHCVFVRAALQALQMHSLDRTAVEVLCGFRPEMVDALWKCDMQWLPERVRNYRNDGEEFIVTNNGSFHRPEVLAYMGHLSLYTPTKKNVLLVPCAADKPYPSPLHKACLDILPDSYYLANATGVVGIVPQDLWPVMPHYDSGIPNRWRLFETLRTYFSKHHHDRVVVYCDFYSVAIHEALSSIGYYDRTEFVLRVQEYNDYVDLLNPHRLIELEQVLLGQGAIRGV